MNVNQKNSNNEQKKSASLKKPIIYTSATMIAGKLIGMSAGVILARILGPEEYGLYAYTMACIGILAVLTSIGLPQYVTRMVAVYKTENKLELMHGLIKTSNKLVLSISTVTTILIIIFLNFYNQTNNEQNLTYYWSLALLPIISLSSIRRSIFEGIQMVAFGKFFEEVLRPTLFIIFTLASSITINKINAEYIMKIQFIAFLLTLIIGSIYLKKYIERMKVEKCEFMTIYWAKNLTPFLLISYTSIITTQADIVILGIFENKEEVGLYRVASQIGLLTSFFIYMAGSVISPKIAHLNIQNKTQEIQKIIVFYSLISFLCCGLLLLIIAVNGTKLLSITFGDSFKEAWLPTMIISLGYLLSCPFALSGNALNMIGNANSTARVFTMSAIMNIALNFSLIPFFGTIGAASAFSITLLIYQISTAYILSKNFNLGIISFFKNLLQK